MLRQLIALTCALALTATGCASLKQKPKFFEVVFAPTAGNSAAGTLLVAAVPDGVRFHGRVTGLAPGSTHGLHVHVRGDCSAPDAGSVGAHFNPTGTEHGDPAGMVHHAGDIANQIADAQGAVDVDVTVHGVSRDTGASDDVIGRALVLDRDADDYTSQPDGNAGAYIACGVILKQ